MKIILKLNFNDQRGFVLVAALLVMVAVTILGIVSIHTSMVELKIARNEREVREAFFLSESAAMEGVQRLADTRKVDLDEKFKSWHHPKKSIAHGKQGFRNPAYWDVDGQGEDNGLQSPHNPETFIAATETAVATGGSLIATESRLYMNRIYGLCTKYNSNTLIEIGYYIRY